MAVGIEAVNAYVGRASLAVSQLFEARGLDDRRAGNLMMERKSVNLPCEDPVTNAVNAARPLVDALPPEDRDRIELVVVGTESGLDFGKPISTYVHRHLGLSWSAARQLVRDGHVCIEEAPCHDSTRRLQKGQHLSVEADGTSIDGGSNVIGSASAWLFTAW